MSLSRQQKYETPEKDEVYDLLSNHRRRYVVHYCKRENGSATLSDLAEQVAAWEQDKALSEVTSAERKRVYTSLQQTHLDRMAEAGIVEFDGDEIELTEKARELDVYLDIVPSSSIPWGGLLSGAVRPCGGRAVRRLGRVRADRDRPGDRVGGDRAGGLLRLLGRAGVSEPPVSARPVREAAVDGIIRTKRGVTLKMTPA